MRTNPKVKQITDSNGIPLKEGQLVAFNCSGDVVLGRIKRLPTKTKVNQYTDEIVPKGPILIKRIWSDYSRKRVFIDPNPCEEAKLSKVKRGNSICVLDEKELMVHLI